MNIKSIVVVVLRIYSLNFLFMGFIKLTPVFISSAVMLAGVDEDFPLAPIVVPYAIIAIFILIGVSFWVFARPLANLITRKLPKEIAIGTFDLTNSYTIAFLALGLFFTIGEFPHTLYWAFHIFKLAASRSGSSWKDEVDFYKVLSDVIPFTFGLMMIFKARFWAIKLEKIHKKMENSEQNDAVSSDAAATESE
jgi:hypothetical protein